MIHGHKITVKLGEFRTFLINAIFQGMLS